LADARASFGPVAERYASSAVHGNPAALKRILDLVQPAGGQMVDIATGSGHTALAFAPHMTRVFAADLTPSMVRVCLREAQKRGCDNVRGVVCRAEVLPFASARLDGATCRIAPHHFDHPPMFITEVRRVLKPGGWFVLVDNVGPEDSDAAKELDAIERERDPSHRSYLSAETWRELLVEHGFRIRHEESAQKPIDIQEWLERMAVPEEKWAALRARIASAEGALNRYLQPTESAFQLREQLFFADNRD
jgi:ubiquinone/menaquinone biosynthesis C-methylase UbiE